MPDAYNSGDLDTGSPGRYPPSGELSAAKRQYRDKVESNYQGSNSTNMWAGLGTLPDYQRKTSSAEIMCAPLPDELTPSMHTVQQTYGSILSHTSRLRDSFILQAITLLNSGALDTFLHSSDTLYLRFDSMLFLYYFNCLIYVVSVLTCFNSGPNM